MKRIAKNRLASLEKRRMVGNHCQHYHHSRYPLYQLTDFS